MDSETVKTIVQALLVFFTGGGLVTFFLAPWQARKVKSETGLNKAQIDINLSSEARNLITMYKEELEDVKRELREVRKKAEKEEARTDFLIDVMRIQGISIPQWPERLQ